MPDRRAGVVFAMAMHVGVASAAPAEEKGDKVRQCCKPPDLSLCHPCWFLPEDACQPAAGVSAIYRVCAQQRCSLELTIQVASVRCDVDDAGSKVKVQGLG